MFFSDHGGVQWLVVFLGNPEKNMKIQDIMRALW